MNFRMSLLPVALLAFAACAKAERSEGAPADSAAMAQPAPAAPAADAGVEKAIAVYRGIEANPAAADSVLAAHGLTQAGLDSLIYDIASDSARAAAYRNAIR